MCPVVRDNTENTDGTAGALVHVFNVANRNLTCTLYSLDPFGVIIDSDSSTTGSSGNQTLYLDVDLSVLGGFYGITCDIPSGAGVHSYEVREPLETDNEGGIMGPGPWQPIDP